MVRLWAFLALVAVVLATPARAAYPDRPVTMVVAFAAGGGTDIAARTVARFMSQRLGQPIVVINKPGAGGEIGFTYLARSAPDGYTLGFINTPNLVTIPLERQAQYHLRDFAPIANVVDDPGGIFVRADSRYKSLKDLLDQARSRPDGISYGTTGVGSDDHLSILALQGLTGIRMTHVAYNGSSAVRQALMTGEIAVGALNMGEGAADARQGLIRSLGQMGVERWPGAPEVQTLREMGLNVVEGSMRGLAAPAGTPREVLRVLASAAEAAMQDPEFRRLADQQYLPLRYLGPDEYLTELQKLGEHYSRLWETSPWRE
jgi:tripartite-type tricarboxylate transporter receptor subunit TctC